MIDCPNCPALLPPETLTRETPCSSCHKAITVVPYAALFRPRPSSTPPTALLSADEASCFFHQGASAVVPCASCGRFLCALCDWEMGGQHYCPTCLENETPSSQKDRLTSQHIRWDRLALHLSLLSFILWFFSLFIAPYTLFLSIRNWKAGCSLVDRSRPRLFFAGLLSLLIILGWITLIIFGVMAVWFPS